MDRACERDAYMYLSEINRHVCWLHMEEYILKNLGMAFQVL